MREQFDNYAKHQTQLLKIDAAVEQFSALKAEWEHHLLHHQQIEGRHENEMSALRSRLNFVDESLKNVNRQLMHKQGEEERLTRILEQYKSRIFERYRQVQEDCFR